MKQKPNIPSWLPHGKAIRSYWEGKQDATISIHMQDGSRSEMPVEIYFRSTEDFPELETFALSLCKGRILDVGAGAGAHSLALQEKGESIVALDISEDAVFVMQERGLKEVYCSAFLDFSSYHQFDTLLFLMNGIGIANDLSGLRSILLHALQLISPDGQLIMDSSDLRIVHDIQPERDTYFGEVSYCLEFDQLIGAPYSWLYIDEHTLNQIAHETGWNMQLIFEEDDGSYLARLSPR